MKIGITQRVDCNDAYLETRDCLDQRWSMLLENLNITIVVIPNCLSKLDDWLKSFNFDGFILSGGNDLCNLPNAKNVAIERDKTEIAILGHAKLYNLPVLGVCRGFQIMNVFMGGDLFPISGHSSRYHEVKFCDGIEFKTELVNSYHTWGIRKTELAKQLSPYAFDSDGNIEAAKHEELNWLGIMWHPEREMEMKRLDLKIISNLFGLETS